MFCYRRKIKMLESNVSELNVQMETYKRQIGELEKVNHKQKKR